MFLIFAIPQALLLLRAVQGAGDPRRLLPRLRPHHQHPQHQLCLREQQQRRQRQQRQQQQALKQGQQQQQQR